MTERSTLSRGISVAEAAIVKRALEVAATDPTYRNLIAEVDRLRVVGQCDCGCASVDFQAVGDLTPVVVADAVCRATDGEQMGLLLWAIDGRLSGLEVYGYSDHPAPLPTLESIRRSG